MQPQPHIKRIIISRPDAIGDVILTLPLCGIIKKYLPHVQVIFLGRTYTHDIINCCTAIDEFINADELLNCNSRDAVIKMKAMEADVIIHVFPHRQIANISKAANIKWRIGTTNRIYHLWSVNKFVRLSRKKSSLHESQLNCRLLSPLGIHEVPPLSEMYTYYHFNNLPALHQEFLSLLLPNKVKVILHPKSNDSAREWNIENYRALIRLLPSDKYQIFVSGTAKEGEQLKGWIATLPSYIVDVTGMFSLSQFIAFINHTDYLIANSTGPLHIAAALGKHVIGIFPPIVPMHPGRWQPLGVNACYLCKDKKCEDCRNKDSVCHCINEISPSDIVSKF